MGRVMDAEAPTVPDQIREWLRCAIEAGASDLHLIVGYPPVLRLHGDLTELHEPPLAGNETEALLFELCPPDARARLKAQKNVDFSFSLIVNGRVQRVGAGHDESHETPPEELTRQNLALDAHARSALRIVHHKARSDFEFQARMDQRMPVALADAIEQQAFDPPAGRVAAPEQPRRKHSRVVGDQQVAAAQCVGQLAERCFPPRGRGAIHDGAHELVPRPCRADQPRHFSEELELLDAAFLGAAGGVR